MRIYSFNILLFHGVRHSTCADGAAAFADGEAEAFFHGDRGDKLDLHLDVVARHDHLDSCGQVCDTGDVRCSEVELRTVARKERRVTSAFFLREDIGLGLELRVRGYRTRLDDDLSTLDLFTLNTAEQESDVVASHTRVEKLLEHLDACDDRVLGLADADDLDRLVDVDDATLDPSRSNCS